MQEIKQKQRVSGFNSIFAVSSVQAAKLYYEEFLKQMTANPEKSLKIAIIYSYGANEEDPDGILDEENPEDTSALDSTSRDFLEKLSVTITSSSTPITIRQATSFKVTIRTFHSV